MTSKRRTIFISYTGDDRPWAEWIAWQLESAGHKSLIDVWDFQPGSNFVLEMDRATAADRTVAILSHAYLDGVYSQPEWAAAFAKDPGGKNSVLIPVRIEDCELTGLLKQIVFVDLVGLGEDEARQEILRAVEGTRRKPASPPVFPRPQGRAPSFPGAVTKSPDNPNSSDPAVEEYLRWAAERYRGMDLVGIGGGDVKLRLEQVYVPLRIAHRRLAEPGAEGHRIDKLQGVDGGGDLELDQIFRTLRNVGRSHAVVLGEPGAGKTTALRKLHQQCLLPGPGSLGLDSGTLPVLLPLRRLAKDDLEQPLPVLAGRYLEEASAGELAADLGEKLWSRGHLLVLLDGLDEVADDARRGDLASYLDWQLSGAADGVRAVVSCRYAGYGGRARLGESFQLFEVRPLAADQVTRLVRLWFREAQRAIPDYSEDEARRRSDDLVEALGGSDYASQQLKVLVSTPLMLTLMCVIVLRGGEMPRQRVEFYEQCLRVLLGKWAKTTKGREPLLAIEVALAVLRPLAWKLHVEERRDDLSKAELVHHVTRRLKDLGAKASAFRVVDWLHRECGVLTEVSPQRYGFLHLGLQEYLAAGHAASGGDDFLGVLADRFGERWWREVVLLLAALPGLRAVNPLLERVLATNALVEQADLLHECLREAPEVSLEPFLAVLDDGSDASRQAAVLRLLSERCDTSLVDRARRLAESPTEDVSALAARIVEQCGERRTAAKPATCELYLVHDSAVAKSAGRLASALRRRGVPLFETESWEEDLEPLLAETRAVAVLVGPGGELPWTRPDVESCLALFEDAGKTVVPVALPQLEKLPELPASWSHWVDLRAGISVEGCEELARAALRPVSKPSRSRVLKTASGEKLVEPRTGLEFVWVPGGRFRMGQEEVAEPVHWVSVSPFWLGETPVINRQYSIFLEATGRDEPPFWRDRKYSEPEQPVVGVSWNDAVAFCEWLSQDFGHQAMLPSEAQWEFAARGIDGRIYPWGDEAPDASRACFDLNWNKDKPAVVGSCPAGRGPYGTLDQAGLVWEWCRDVWNKEAYRERDEPKDPLVTEGDEDRRVLRGGSWVSPADDLRAAVRFWLPATGRYDFVGFRVLAAPPSFDS